MSTALGIVKGLNVLVDVAISLGINWRRFVALKELAPDGKLTDEQLQMLANEARDAVERM